MQINTPDVDPSRGLVPLRVDVVDVARLVGDNICARTAKSSFTYTGRGGLSPSPDNTLNNDAVWEDWRLTNAPYEHRSTTAKKPITPKLTTPEPIVEATGWIKNEKGDQLLLRQMIHGKNPYLARNYIQCYNQLSIKTYGTQ